MTKQFMMMVTLATGVHSLLSSVLSPLRGSPLQLLLAPAVKLNVLDAANTVGVEVDHRQDWRMPTGAPLRRDRHGWGQRRNGETRWSTQTGNCGKEAGRQRTYATSPERGGEGLRRAMLALPRLRSATGSMVQVPRGPAPYRAHMR